MDSQYLDLDRKILIKKIRINGIKRSNDAFLRAQFKPLLESNSLKEVMECYDDICKILLKNSVVSHLDIFCDVMQEDDTKVSFKPNVQPVPVEIVVDLEEKNLLTGEARVNIGMDNSSNFVLSMRLNNLNGKGSSISANYSKDANMLPSVSFNYQRPTPSHRFSAFSTTLAVKDYLSTNYSVVYRLIDTAITYQIPSLLGGLHFLSFENKISKANGLPAKLPTIIRGDMGLSLKHSFKHTFISDGRDNCFFPNKGSCLKLINEVCGLFGGIQCIKNQLRVEHNKQLNDRTVFTGVLDIGMVTPYGKYNSVPVEERFLLGGYSDLRGFKRGGVGRNVYGYPLGSDLMANAGFHLNFQLPFAEQLEFVKDNLRLHLFTNVGKCGMFIPEQFCSYSMKGLWRNFYRDPLRISAGIGISAKVMNKLKLELNFVQPLKFSSNDITCKGFSFGLGIEFN